MRTRTINLLAIITYAGGHTYNQITAKTTFDSTSMLKVVEFRNAWLAMLRTFRLNYKAIAKQNLSDLDDVPSYRIIEMAWEVKHGAIEFIRRYRVRSSRL
jgi:hypothetical protein